MTAKTQFKTEIVKRYKNGESSYQISKDEGCSYNAVLRELKRRGVNTGLSFWTKNEIEKLKELYPITYTIELLKEFPNRKKESIERMAKKSGFKKRECERICRGCGKEFTIKHKHNRKLCSKCVKKQWEHNNLENGRKRKKQWLQRNPEYMKNYVKTPKARKRINQYFRQYFRQLRKESPKFRLDDNMRVAIYLSLKGKKAGRKWQELVGYNLKELMKHLENQFDKEMKWENYGRYWHLDHIRPKSLFKYISPEDSEFKECWSLKNLQPLEKIANLRKSNTFAL